MQRLIELAYPLCLLVIRRRTIMTKPENQKSPDQKGQVEHPERHVNSQRNKTRDLNESKQEK
jgi:hypothetical protein